VPICISIAASAALSSLVSELPSTITINFGSSVVTDLCLSKTGVKLQADFAAESVREITLRSHDLQRTP